MSDTPEPTQETNTAAPAVEAPALTLVDLTQALQLIQAVAQRGAIRADEMATVGALHDRLYAFLVAQGAISRAPTAN